MHLVVKIVKSTIFLFQLDRDLYLFISLDMKNEKAGNFAFPAK